jgi:hypothetical protein
MLRLLSGFHQTRQIIDNTSVSPLKRKTRSRANQTSKIKLGTFRFCSNV